MLLCLYEKYFKGFIAFNANFGIDTITFAQELVMDISLISVDSLRIAKGLLIALLALSLSSCEENVNNQDSSIPQDIATDKLVKQEAAYYEIIQLSVLVPEFTAMTPITAVEPELLRNVMPNSWQRLTRLSVTEKQEFITAHTETLLQIAHSRWNNDLSYFLIFREQVGVDAFYRILLTASSEPDFMSSAIQFNQYMMYQGSVISSLLYRYGHASPTTFGSIMSFSGIDIITDGENARGVLSSYVRVPMVSDPERWSRTTHSIRDGQIRGWVGGELFLMNDILHENRRPVPISASDILVDPNIPRRFGLQSAFDGNPSTTFVANCADEILGISVGNAHLPGRIQRIAIINGHAQDMASYRNNNRVRAISVWGFEDDARYTVELSDYMLSWQIVETWNPFLIVSEIHYGEIYKNTLIAGFNLYIENFGWLFGTIDE